MGGDDGGGAVKKAPLAAGLKSEQTHGLYHVATDGQVEYIGLIDSIEHGAGWLKMPFDAMQDVGPAAQTLGGILRFTDKETYVPLDDIATAARLPKGTVKKHLVKLDAGGWIYRKGREKLRSGWLRRTATIQVTAKARAAAATAYGVLPLWACDAGRLTWAARAVLSIVLGRLMSLKAAIEEQDGHGLETEDYWGSISNMGDEDRFRFSHDSLHRQTGLFQGAVIDAKRQLSRAGIVDWMGADGSKKGDVLYPKEDFSCA
jgi:DNA-binding MarR family transcriptional regulator